MSQTNFLRTQMQALLMCVLEIDDESITSEEDDAPMEESTDRPQSSKETDKQKADALKQQICRCLEWYRTLLSKRILLFSALWDSFLELRIKLQRATITCNCLPTAVIDDDDDQELREVMDESKRNPQYSILALTTMTMFHYRCHSVS